MGFQGLRLSRKKARSSITGTVIDGIHGTGVLAGTALYAALDIDAYGFSTLEDQYIHGTCLNALAGTGAPVMVYHHSDALTLEYRTHLTTDKVLTDSVKILFGTSSGPLPFPIPKVMNYPPLTVPSDKRESAARVTYRVRPPHRCLKARVPPLS